MTGGGEGVVQLRLGEGEMREYVAHDHRHSRPAHRQVRHPADARPGRQLGEVVTQRLHRPVQQLPVTRLLVQPQQEQCRARRPVQQARSWAGRVAARGTVRDQLREAFGRVEVAEVEQGEADSGEAG